MEEDMKLPTRLHKPSPTTLTNEDRLEEALALVGTALRRLASTSGEGLDISSDPSARARMEVEND